MENQRPRRRCVGARDVVVGKPALDVILRIVDGFDGPGAVGGRERNAVGKPYAFANVIDDRLAVGADAAIAQRRHGGGKVGHQVPSIVVLQQVGEDEHRPLGRRRPVFERWIEGLRLPLLGDDEGTPRCGRARTRRNEYSPR